MPYPHMIFHGKELYPHPSPPNLLHSYLEQKTNWVLANLMQNAQLKQSTSEINNVEQALPVSARSIEGGETLGEEC